MTLQLAYYHNSWEWISLACNIAPVHFLKKPFDPIIKWLANLTWSKISLQEGLDKAWRDPFCPDDDSGPIEKHQNICTD